MTYVLAHFRKENTFDGRETASLIQGARVEQGVKVKVNCHDKEFFPARVISVSSLVFHFHQCHYFM